MKISTARKGSGPLLAAVILVTIVAGGVPAAAQTIDGFGQFIVAKLAGDSHGGDSGRIFLGNPTDRPVFSLVIVYDPDGELVTEFGSGGCEGAVLRPHGGASFLGDNPDGGFPDTDLHALEVITVRNNVSDPLYGRFGNALQLQQVGAYLKGSHKIRSLAVRPSAFHLPTGEQKDLLIDCACVEVDAFNLGNDLLEEVGIFCPDLPRGGEAK